MYEDEKAANGILHLCPTTSGSTRRYLPPQNRIRVDHMSICAFDVLAPTLTQPRSGGWERIVHPEGKPYFYDSTKQIPTVTDSDLMDDDTLHKIEHAYELVLERINGTLLDTDSLNLELLLELDPEDENTCDYYLVDHDSKTLFWMEEGVTTESLNLHPVSSLEHLKMQLLREYWLHVEHFPHVVLDPNAKSELLETLNWSCLDHMTCETSSAAYPSAKVERFIALLNNCPKGSETWTIARLSALIVGHQFFNYHGLVGARLERTISVEADGGAPPVGFFMKFFFLLLLNAPNTTLDKLNKLWVDKMLYAEQWEKFVTDLLRDWTDISLLASVLLAANTAFLALVVSQPYPTAASMVSTILSLGSILTSLVNGRQQRSRLSPLANLAGAFLERMCHPTMGLQLLAVFFALPYALMLWSVVAFAGAILLQSLAATDSFSIAVIAASGGFVMLLIMVTVLFVWLDDRQWEHASETSWFSWWRNAVRKIRGNREEVDVEKGQYF